MHEQYHKWYTQYLSRDLEMLVFGHSGYPIVLFPTSNGRYYENKDFGLVSAAARLIDLGKIKIYCPDSIDGQSWYNYSISPADRVKTHMAYEEAIIHDVVDFAIYETESKTVGLAGCSFGGYHAMNLAFRHPEKVGYLMTMGGAFDIKQFIYGYYDDNCYFNNPPDYMDNLSDKWFLENIKNIGIVLGTGDMDMCLDDNRKMSDILNKKGIDHWLDVRTNVGHDWAFWREMFPQYLSKIEK